MDREKICITTDCACDLPKDIMEKYNIDVMYFYIETDTGVFRDVDEITAANLFEYLNNGGQRTETMAPPVEEFQSFFEEKLKEYEHVIHVAISSRISKCVSHSTEAISRIEGGKNRVHIVDSHHLSTGLGTLVLRGVEMLEAGKDVEEIVSELEKVREKISTTFMAYNADYLYRNGKVSKGIKVVCSAFNIHPVLEMKDGYLKLKSIMMGNYEKSAIKYIRRELRKPDQIDKKRLFITHAGCSVSDIKMVRNEVSKRASFETVLVTNASATISGNSGPRTFGLLFMRK